MTADTDTAYTPLRLQPLRITDYLAVEHLMEIVHGIDIVNHAYVEVIGAQLFQLQLERSDGLRHIARAQILVVLPCGAKMPLNHETVASAFECRAYVAAQIGIRRIDVDEINAVRNGEIQIRLHLVSPLVHEPFAAESNRANADSRASQYSVLHILLELLTLFEPFHEIIDAPHLRRNIYSLRAVMHAPWLHPMQWSA